MRLLAALAVAATLTAACGSGGGDAASSDDATAASSAGSGAGATVEVSDFEFTPQAVTAAVDEEITWTVASDSSAHTVKFDDEESEQLAAGDTYSRSFSEAGEYDYICGIHPQMTGTVTVE